MDTNSEREQLKKAYSGKSWHRKVDEMRPGQVHAIYVRFKNQNKI